MTEKSGLQESVNLKRIGKRRKEHNGIQFLEYQTFILKIYLEKHEFHAKYRATRFDKF
jgi:hypothetical protein